MKKIIAIGGSSSANSINKRLVTYVCSKISAETTVIDLNSFELPLYSIDLENESGIPKNARLIDDLITAADGIVISLAEHNGSYSAAFKNLFDWLSRIDQKVWKDKPMFLMATSPGARGGKSVLETAKKGFPYLGAKIITTYSLPKFNDNFSETGIKNQLLSEELTEKAKHFEKMI